MTENAANAPSLYSRPTVTGLRRDQARVAGDIIGAAFDDDPVNRWVFGKGPLAPTFTSLARHRYLKLGSGDVARDDDGAAMGAALWLPDARAEEASLWSTLCVAGTIARTAGFGAM